MNPLRKRINLIFGVLCIPIAFQFFLGFLLGILTVLREYGIFLSDYTLSFVIPQTVYPLLNALLALTVLLSLPRQRGVKGMLQPVKKDFFPWFGFFLGAVTVGNFANNFLMTLFERLTGIGLPAVFSEYDPSTVGQGVLFFFVIAVLPAVSEELLFRGLGGGGLAEFHPTGAVVLSAFAFGLMHATVQQIPFAVFMGLVFGLIYVRTGNLLYPILLHFANNTWACAITFLQIAFGEEVTGIVYLIGSTVFFVAGIVSFRWLKKNGKLTLKEAPARVDGKTVLQSTLTSVGFWGFTALHVLLTVLNLMS